MMPVQMSDHLIRWRCRGDGARFALGPSGKAAMLVAAALLVIAVLATTDLRGQELAVSQDPGEERF